jgi:hypothetical protein
VMKKKAPRSRRRKRIFIVTTQSYTLWSNVVFRFCFKLTVDVWMMLFRERWILLLILWNVELTGASVSTGSSGSYRLKPCEPQSKLVAKRQFPIEVKFIYEQLIVHVFVEQSEKNLRLLGRNNHLLKGKATSGQDGCSGAVTEMWS